MTTLTAPLQESKQSTTAEKAPVVKRFRADLLVVGAFILAAFYVTARLWADLGGKVYANSYDPYWFEWLLGHAAHSVVNFENPFFNDNLNVPDGVNLMANTAVLGIGIPLTPITLLFGPHFSYMLAITGGLAGTAIAWYWLLSRHMNCSRLAAVAGAGVAGFGPAMISHAGAHVNFVSQFLIPIIIWRVICLREQGRWLRNGVILGLLVTYQVFINEELLLYTALAIGVFLGVYAWLNWADVRESAGAFFRGLGVTAAITIPLLAYPLWFQFKGPRSYSGIPGFASSHGADLTSWFQYARETLAGNSISSSAIVLNQTEENTLLSGALILLATIFAVWLWHDKLARAIAICAITFGVLALGPKLLFKGKETGIPLPWWLVDHLPVFNAVLPSRFGLVVFPCVAILVAIGLTRATARKDIAKFAWIAAAVVLIPLAPTPLPAEARNHAPAFITEGMWRPYAEQGYSVVPTSNLIHDGLEYDNSDDGADAMAWQAAERFQFTMPRGYFLGPGGENKRARFSGADRPTSLLLTKVAKTKKGKQAPVVTEENRAAAVKDMAFWNAGVIVLTQHPNQTLIQQTLESLLGPGTRQGDTWVWDVRNVR